MLAHLLENTEYAAYYAQRHSEGEYLILDNSAHEHGKGNPMDVLLDLATSVGADEVVVPDVLFDRRGTLQGARKALEYLRTSTGRDHYFEAGTPTLMFVPQGTSRKDWRDCMAQLANMWGAHLASTGQSYNSKVVFGVSKDYDYVRGGISSLVTEIDMVRKKMFPLTQVHCLGWPADLWSIAQVAREHPWVRSTDSAKPFVYAANEILLEPGGDVPKYPHREVDYFSTELSDLQARIAERNVEVYLATARDVLMQSPTDEEDE